LTCEGPLPELVGVVGAARPAARRARDGPAQEDCYKAAVGDPSASERIAEWRRRIDAIDLEILALLNERARCAVEVGRDKQRLDLPAWAPEREAEILNRVVKANPGPLDEGAVRRLFERIIDEARSLERHVMQGASEE
jgi:chorismate mutase